MAKKKKDASTETPNAPAAELAEIVYTGTRPFVLGKGYPRLAPGATVGPDHPLFQHRAALLARIDFEEVTRG